MNWQALIAREGDRAAIYDERFPGRLAALPVPADATTAFTFGAERAQAILVIFARHWDHLPTSEADPAVRFHRVALDVDDGEAHLMVHFSAVLLADGHVVVFDVACIEPRQ